MNNNYPNETDLKDLDNAAPMDGVDALDGIKVVDLSRLVAGNMLSLQLADFGADVIKVEPLPAGDTLRAWKEDGHSMFWKIYGRNKRSLGLNFREAGSIELLRQLATGADILIESFRPGTLEAMGLAPDELHKSNPRLIIVRISGYGQTGPHSHRPGFGTLMEAMSGFAARNGFDDREPVLPPIPLADMISGLYGAFSTLTALRARDHLERSGARSVSGQVIDLSLLDSVISVLGSDIAAYQLTGTVKPRLGSGSNQAGPRGVYLTRDHKWVAISASTQKAAMRFLKLIGGEELTRDPRFLDNTLRVKNRDELDGLINEWMGKRNRTEALETIDREGITAGPVYDASEILQDPHISNRGLFFECPDQDLGHVMAHTPVPRLSASPGRFRFPAPEIGEHSEQILLEFGIQKQEIARMINSGLIGVKD